MKNTVKELTSRQKKAILEKASEAVKNGKTKQETVKILCNYLKSLSLVSKGGNYDGMLSVSLAFYSIEKCKFEGLSAIECLSSYAAFKRASEKHVSDYGAFGDFLETALRLSCKPLNLANYNDLRVKRQNETDITIRGKRCEIGTNGKTFSESTENNPMAGKFEFVVYGVFTSEQKETLYRLAILKQYEKLFERIKSMMYVFKKDEFVSYLNSTGKGNMIKYKPNLNHWQIVYNESKHYAFLRMVEEQKIVSLAEWIASR